jgi:hypothetical protein
MIETAAIETAHTQGTVALRRWIASGGATRAAVEQVNRDRVRRGMSTIDYDAAKREGQRPTVQRGWDYSTSTPATVVREPSRHAVRSAPAPRPGALPPVGIIVLSGIGNITTRPVAGCTTEIAARSAFDLSVQWIGDRSRPFVMKRGHHGPTVAKAGDGLEVFLHDDGSPYAIWRPDADRREHRQVVAAIAAGKITHASAEVVVLRDLKRSGIRVIRTGLLTGVALLEADGPAYKSAKVGLLDDRDPHRSCRELIHAAH